MERNGEQSKFHQASWLRAHGQIVLCIHLLMCGQKTFIISLSTKWPHGWDLVYWFCLFVCLFRVQFKHLPIFIEHEDYTENTETTSGVSYIKSSARGSQAKHCISGEKVASRCHGLLQGQILPPIGHAIIVYLPLDTCCILCMFCFPFMKKIPAKPQLKEEKKKTLSVGKYLSELEMMRLASVSLLV